MKTLIMAILYMVCLTLQSLGAGTANQNAEDVSLIKLIASPNAFSGKLVRVIGFLNIEFEGNAIYLHQEDFDKGLHNNGLWVSPSAKIYDEMKKMSGKYVLIEGIFDSKGHGHMGLWSGEIVNISRAEIWPPRSSRE